MNTNLKLILAFLGLFLLACAAVMVIIQTIYTKAWVALPADIILIAASVPTFKYLYGIVKTK